jgi:hypothetical protein
MLFGHLVLFFPAFAQTEVPPQGPLLQQDDNDADLSTGAQQTQSTTPGQAYDEPTTNLIDQMAEQDTTEVVTNVNQLLQGNDLGAPNDVYEGIKNFWNNDVVSDLFSNIGQLIGRWIDELINGWIADTVQFLTAFLRTFVLNPNIAVNGLGNLPGGGNSNDDISPYIREGADVMYGIAVDLLLLLFILCIWKYWVEASWRGGAGLMGAVGRLIATAGLMLAWPTIYAFEIQITNEMIKAIYFNSADQVVMLDAAMAAVVKGGLLATTGLVANAFAPVVGMVAGGALGGGAGGLVMGTVGDVVAFAGLVIYLIIGGILIAELVYILILKAIQTALLTAQYMFAPIFLVFFATPDTESVTAGFVKSFVEVSLWTFVWVGLLKIMVIILFSQFNPWGKIVMAVGVLQIMIQTPSFLARAQISPMSDFISAGLITGGLMKGAANLGNVAKTRVGQGFDYMMNQQYSSRGTRNSEAVDLNRTPRDVSNPELLKGIRDTANNNVMGGPGKPHTDAKGKDLLNMPGKKDDKKKPGEKSEEEKKKEAMAAGAGKDKDLKSTKDAKTGDLTKTPTPAGKKTPTSGAGLGLGSGAQLSTAPGTDPSKTKKEGAAVPGSAVPSGVKTAAAVAGGAAAVGAAAAAFGGSRALNTAERDQQKQEELNRQKAATDQAQQAALQAKSEADKLKGLNDKEEHDKDTLKSAPNEAAKLKTAEGAKDDQKEQPKPGDKKAPPTGFGGGITPPRVGTGETKKPATPGSGTASTTPGSTEAKLDATRTAGQGAEKKPGTTAAGTGGQGQATHATVPGIAAAGSQLANAKADDKNDKTKLPQNPADAANGLKTDDDKEHQQPGQEQGGQLKLRVTPPVTPTKPGDPSKPATGGVDANGVRTPVTGGTATKATTEGLKAGQTGVSVEKGAGSQRTAPPILPGANQTAEVKTAGAPGQQHQTPGQNTGDIKGLPTADEHQQPGAEGSQIKAALLPGQGKQTAVPGQQRAPGAVGSPEVKATPASITPASATASKLQAGDVKPGDVRPAAAVPGTQQQAGQADMKGLTAQQPTTPGKGTTSSGMAGVSVGPGGEINVPADGAGVIHTVDANGNRVAIKVSQTGQKPGESKLTGAATATAVGGPGSTPLAGGPVPPVAVRPGVPGLENRQGVAAAATTANLGSQTAQGQSTVQSAIKGVGGQQEISLNQHHQQEMHGVDANGNRIVIRPGTSSVNQQLRSGGGVPQLSGAAGHVTPPTGAAGQQTRVPQLGGQNMQTSGTGQGVAAVPGHGGTVTMQNSQELRQAALPTEIEMQQRYGVGYSDGQVLMRNGQAIFQPHQAAGQPARAAFAIQTAPPVGAGRAPISNVSTVPHVGAGPAVGATALGATAVAHGKSPDPFTAQPAPPAAIAQGLNEVPTPTQQQPQAIGDPFAMFDQSNYRWVPGRGLAMAVRTAQGPTIGKLQRGRGGIEVIGGQKGVMHMRYGSDVTPEQRALMVMAGGYANDSVSDVQGYDAARQSCIDAGEDGPKNMVERMAAGYMAHEGKSFKQTVRAKERFQRAMFKQALIGSEAYVNGEQGNAYTNFLNQRYGPMSEEQQAWGVHMFTDPTSPESGWSPKVGPATETLFNAGIPITAGYRAAAANPAVLKSAAWARGPAIRGVAAYVDAQADRMCGPTTPPTVRDALIGRLAPNVDAAEVNACQAIMQEATTVEEGERTIKQNPILVKTIAQLVAGGSSKDPISAYRSLKSVSSQVANRAPATAQQNWEVASSNGGGGGGATSMPPPQAPVGGGSGAEQMVDAIVRDPGTSNMAANNIAGGTLQSATGGVAPIQRRVNMSFDHRGSLPTVRAHIEQNVSGHIVGQDVHMQGGASHPAQQNVDVDVTTRGATHSLGSTLPSNLPLGTRQVKQDVRVNILPDRHAGGPDQHLSFEAPSAGGYVNTGATVSYTGAGSSSSGGQVTETTRVDMTERLQGSRSGVSAAQAAAIAGNSGNRTGHSIHKAQQFIIDMHAAGFRDDQIQDPRIVQNALDVYDENPALLPVAAVVAQKLGPNDFSKQAVQVVDMMVEAGWNPNQISRPDIVTAAAIIDSGGGYPTPKYVREVRQFKDFSPKMGKNNQLPKIPTQIVNQFAKGTGDETTKDQIARPFPW